MCCVTGAVSAEEGASCDELERAEGVDMRESAHPPHCCSNELLI